MTKSNTIISKYYPGFVKKAISFTIDDGNYPLDKKLMDIVGPAGITGAFNLCGDDRRPSGISDEEYRALYKGYEIANHAHHHPMVLFPSDEVELSDKPFDAKTADLSDKTTIYKSDVEGMYFKSFGRYFGKVACEDTYIRLVEEGKRQLDKIFGKESISAFVWPYREQASEKVKAYLKSAGYKSVRRTGTADFSIPEDKMSWCYNAIHSNLLERAEEYDSLDSEELTFFCFGVHSHDFENANCWDVLESFAEKYGRRLDFYYATPSEIFNYADAAESLIVTEGAIENPSDIDVFITVNGTKTTVPAHTCVIIK